MHKSNLEHDCFKFIRRYHIDFQVKGNISFVASTQTKYKG